MEPPWRITELTLLLDIQSNRFLHHHFISSTFCHRCCHRTLRNCYLKKIDISLSTFPFLSTFTSCDFYGSPLCGTQPQNYESDSNSANQASGLRYVNHLFSNKYFLSNFLFSFVEFRPASIQPDGTLILSRKRLFFRILGYPGLLPRNIEIRAATPNTIKATRKL